MALLEILEFPDDRLRTKAKPITVFDDALRQRVADMFETMYAAPGIGLAATQVNDHRQLIVIDISEDRSGRLVLINPKIVASQGATCYEEGCLSVPEVRAKVDRANEITVEAQDPWGASQTIHADGLLAVCIQHEMDHLAGKVFVDHLSPLKRQLVLRKLEKLRREKQQQRRPATAATQSSAAL
jgi:peptide deformylase